MELQSSYKTFSLEPPIESNSTGNGSCNSHCVSLKQMKSWRRQIVLILAPLLLIPLATLGQEGRAAFVILLMALYWIFDVIQVAATAFLPILLYPLFGIVSAREISVCYFEDIVILFVCGLMIAVTIDEWGLHKRIALKVILMIGTQADRIMLGFMLTTAFISMWMSNTATTAMMTPIAEAVLKKLEETERKETEQPPEFDGSDEQQLVLEQNDDEPLVLEEEKLLDKESKKKFNNMCTGLMLSIAFSANIGGTATLTGTAPNLILVGQLKTLFGPEAGISFLQWFVFSFPVTITILMAGWLWLNVMYLDFSFKRCLRRDQTNFNTAVIIQEQYNSLGEMSFAEKGVLFHFVLIALLWVFRDPKFVPGWTEIFNTRFISDGTAGMFVVLLLFIVPSKKPELFCWNTAKKVVTVPPSSLLTWSMVRKKFPWDIVILLGGGLAMAEGAKRSGLSVWLGCQLITLSNVPHIIMVFLVCLLVSTMTEVSSNIAIATIFTPVIASLAQSVHIHPYYLLIPATICSSFAFMLPVATPPNALVFATGRVTIRQMVKAGICMDVIGIMVLLLAITTYGTAYFNLDKYPAWAHMATGNLTCQL